MADPRQARRYRFGVFEADAATGELRKQGVRTRVNLQPFQVLLILLERPGELLTREEISRELWPDGTFVDYEHGVNSAVNRLRDALGDKANSSRFIETLARRGYRFVAPVERIPLNGDSSTATPTLRAPEAPPVTSTVPSAPVEPRPRLLDRVLATPEDLPKSPHLVVQ